MELDDIEYESFSYGFDINEGRDEGFCIEYESFSFDPMMTDLLLESRKFEFIESEILVPMIADLDQTLAEVELKELVDLGLILCLDCSFMMMKFLGQ